MEAEQNLSKPKSLVRRFRREDALHYCFLSRNGRMIRVKQPGYNLLARADGTRTISELALDSGFTQEAVWDFFVMIQRGGMCEF